MFDDVLAFQLKETVWGIGFATAVPVKLTPVLELPLIVTVAVGGLNVYPALLTATTYEPFGRLEKVYVPELVVAERETGPDRVNVAPFEPLTVPEILYEPELGGGVVEPAGLKTTSTQ